MNSFLGLLLLFLATVVMIATTRFTQPSSRWRVVATVVVVVMVFVAFCFGLVGHFPTS